MLSDVGRDSMCQFAGRALCKMVTRASLGGHTVHRRHAPPHAAQVALPLARRHRRRQRGRHA